MDILDSEPIDDDRYWNEPIVNDPYWTFSDYYLIGGFTWEERKIHIRLTWLLENYPMINESKQQKFDSKIKELIPQLSKEFLLFESTYGAGNLITHESLFSESIRIDNVDIFKQMLEKGIDPELNSETVYTYDALTETESSYKANALMVAIICGSESIIEFLLLSECNIEACDSRGETVWDCSMESYYPKISDRLIKEKLRRQLEWRD